MAESIGPGSSARMAGREYVHRVWVTVGIIAVVGGAILLLWLAFDVALLFFASVLLAIFLRTLADWAARHLRLGPTSALALVIAALLLVCGLIGWLLAAPISTEVDQLKQDLPKAVTRLELQLENFAWGKEMVSRLRQPSGLLSQAGSLFSRLSNVFSVTIKGVVYAWVVLFSGFYLATQPGFYLEGFLGLLPAPKRPHGRVVLQRIGRGLRNWLFGQILSMTIIGVCTWFGLFLLGIPLSAALGLLAGILDFVPVAGPWVAGIVSCILALMISPLHAVYVACLFTGLHLVEGHVLVPQVQKHATRLPPVLTVLAMVLFEVLFGLLGLFLATPLLVFIMISTRALYVEDILEPQPTIVAESQPRKAA